MSRTFKIGVVGLLAVVALAIVLTGTVLAQEATPTPAPSEPVPKFFGGHGMGRGMGRTIGGQIQLEAAAEALGMTADELSTQLWGGKTLADIAEEKGVDLQAVRAAVEAAQEQAVRDAIEQAVEDGTLTREHADWLLEGLDKGFWSGHGFGGFGPGHGRGGMGMGGRGGFGGFRGNSGFSGFGRLPYGNSANTGTSGA